MDKREKLDMLEAAIELVAANAGAVRLLKGVHRAVRLYPHITTLSQQIRLDKICFTNDVADVLELVAQDLD